MSVQEPSAPAPPPSFVAPFEERTPSPSNSLGDAPTTGLPPGKKTASKKKKASKKKVVKNAEPVEPADAPAPQQVGYRYEPYRKASPTPEVEGNLPADPEELATLDATAKMLYKSDREVLEYIDSLKHRTAAVLEHVHRTDSQLRSCNGAMERIQLFVAQWQKMEDHWTPQQLFGDGKFRAKWVDDRMNLLDSDESDDEDNAPNPDLFPTLIRDENRAFPTVEEHFSRNVNHPDFPHDYVRNFLEGQGPQPSKSHDGDEEEGDFFRPETPPARQPSLPPGHEDGNDLEYAEEEIEIHSDFPAPPNHAAPASDDSTFDRSGADLRITSDTDILFAPSDEEFARISKGLKREAMDLAAARTMPPPADPLRPRHPLTQSYVPSSSPPSVPQPEPQHLAVPWPIPHAPSSSHTVLGGKRKRASTPEEEEGNVAGPSTVVVHPNFNISRQVEVRNSEDRASPKKRRMIARQPTWDFQMFAEAGFVPPPPRVDPPTRENSPDLSSQPAHRQASPPSIPASQIQKEDSEVEKSQVIEMLSQIVEQGESGDEEESTGNILGGLGGSQHSLPALTADNTQSTATPNTQSEAETPAESQVFAKVPTSTPEDVFGPIVLSAKAHKISNRLPAEVFWNGADRDIVMSDSGQKVASTSKSTRFSLEGRVEKGEHQVFRKTPIRPRASLTVTEAEYALAAEAVAEGQDMLKPLLSPKKKRAIGARAHKSKPASPVKADSTVNPEDGLPSISASKPSSRLRRGRSASVQPEVPAFPKTPVKKSTRSKK